MAKSFIVVPDKLRDGVAAEVGDLAFGEAAVGGKFAGVWFGAPKDLHGVAIICLPDAAILAKAEPTIESKLVALAVLESPSRNVCIKGTHRE